MTGMLSRGEIGLSQPGQCEGGRTTDSPRGTRQMTTLRNDPMSRPSTPQKIAVKAVTQLLGPAMSAPRLVKLPELAPTSRQDRSFVSSSRKLFLVTVRAGPGKALVQQESNSNTGLPVRLRFFENKVP